MDENLNFFDGIISTLENSVHPEIYHFRNGSHPGKQWFLKTVCPMPKLKQVDHLGFGELWEIFCQDNNHLAQIVPYAYDWKGKEIPYCASVWVRCGVDVVLSFSEIVGFQFEIMEEKEGREYYIGILEEIIYQARHESKDSIQYPSDILDQLDEIEIMLEGMKKNARVLDVEHLRNTLKIIEGGKE